MGIMLATEADIPQILEIYRPYVEKTTYSFEYTAPTLEEFTQRFRLLTAQFPWLVYRQEGRIVGYAYGSAPFERAAYQWVGEVSVYLAEEAWGQGIGSALYRTLEQIMACQGYTKVYALVTQENAGSLAFHRAVGYRDAFTVERCGFKMGRWLGVIWLEKLLNPVEKPEDAPTPVHKVVNIHRFFP